jgi:hypothetical protein
VDYLAVALVAATLTALVMAGLWRRHYRLWRAAEWRRAQQVMALAHSMRRIGVEGWPYADIDEVTED